MISLDYFKKLKKSKIRSEIFYFCFEQPSCSIEIANKIYGGIKHYEDRYVNKILNEFKNNGLVDIVGHDYDCKNNRATHYYVTDEIFLNLIKALNKKFGGKKSKIAEKYMKDVIKNRRKFIEIFLKQPFNIKEVSQFIS